MGVIVQAESHRNELAAVYELEHDPDVLEYFDQPPPIKLLYRDKHDRKLGIVHTPDFFEIRNHSAGWVECKTQDDLLSLSQNMPSRYVYQATTGWVCPPGDSFASVYGLSYRIRSSSETNWVFQRNILFLDDYLRGEPLLSRNDTTSTVLSLVAANPGISLKALLDRATGATRDDLNAMIATEMIYADLRAVPLTETQNVRLFRDSQTASAYLFVKDHSAQGQHTPLSPVIDVAVNASIVWDNRPWTILNVGLHRIALLAPNDEVAELPLPVFENLIREGKIAGLPKPKSDLTSNATDRLAKASPDDLHVANMRYQIIAPLLAGSTHRDETIPARTTRHWLSQYRSAEQSFGNGWFGLLPRHRQKGNRLPRLPEATLVLMREFIETRYETLKQKRKSIVYGELLRECRIRGILCPSYKTFAQAIGRRPRLVQAERRRGPRAAYPYEPFYWELELTTPRHGDRPFEICHVDHTQLDIELVASTNGSPLGRPWLTILTDAYSRSVLALSLSFDSPSYRSCMNILRECVRRHNRLPQILVVDGGPEFNSTYFESLLARYECTKKQRPPAKARFGSVCERMFGTANTQFVHNLRGNTQLTKHIRHVTKNVAPATNACWTLGALYEHLCEWAYEVYDLIDHPTLGQTPRDALLLGLQVSGARPQRRITYNDEFYILTLPTTRKGTAKVEISHGVKMNYIYYWSDTFRDPSVEKTRVPVRFDPNNAGVAYAFVKGSWIRCVSQHYAILEGRSEKEVLLATLELRRQRQQHQRQSPVTAARIADFLTSVDATEALQLQQLRDREARQGLTLIEGGRERPQFQIPTDPTVPDRDSHPTPTTAVEAQPLDSYEEYR